jgi:hypothetical protein
MILSAAAADLARLLERNLREIFGNRLRSLSVYRPATDASDTAVHTMVTVDSLGPDDLRACADAGRWSTRASRRRSLCRPRSCALARRLPWNSPAIRAEHILVAGDPFVAVKVDDADLRREVRCVTAAHLREFHRDRGGGDRVADLVTDSAQPLAGLVKASPLSGVDQRTIEAPPATWNKPPGYQREADDSGGATSEAARRRRPTPLRGIPRYD